jgi:hypothetical protein
MGDYGNYGKLCIKTIMPRKYLCLVICFKLS